MEIIAYLSPFVVAAIVLIRSRNNPSADLPLDDEIIPGAEIPSRIHSRTYYG